MKKLVDGVLQDMTPEEVAAYQAVAADAPALKAQEIRNKRAVLLVESDWTQMPDYKNPNKDAWATYRQALRDVPTQSGFPWDINWPNKPE